MGCNQLYSKYCGGLVNLAVNGLLLLQLLLPASVVVDAAGVSSASEAPCYPAQFVFGDSLSDTGNGVLTGSSLLVRTAQRPYGETVPGFPFNRFSDGLLLVDFLATRVGLPFVNPYLNSSADFRKGANYAVSGAAALNEAYLTSQGIVTATNFSLDVQLGWHLALKASASSSPQKPSLDAYNKGLYVIEIGDNDYIGALDSLLYSPSYIATTFIPLVISKIRNASELLYANGARNFVYISLPPRGCSPFLLATFPSSSAKDSNGCLQDVNNLTYSHGVHLLNLVRDLRTIHPDANFTYVDYYGAYTQVIEDSSTYGFLDTLDACCGGGPTYPYGFNTSLFCNSLSSTTLSTLCTNPNTYLNWDGIHFTHQFNSQIFNLTINTGSYLDPPNAFTTCCTHTIP